MNATGIGMVAGAVSGAIVGFIIGWLGRGVVVDHIQIPAVIEQQVSLCTAATQKAAADAVAAEQLRQFKIGEGATQRFITESLVAADDARARQDVLEMEIANYAQRVAAAEGRCALNDIDLEFLGLRQAAQPDNRSGR